MLKHLHIQNYALIAQLDIDFAEGFSVLTGETGAGKSIILGALGLAMGARADIKAITEGEDKCIIEAEFSECVVRRELYANGKSRSFVDDSLVSLAELKTLAARLLDIHSQHANLLLENDAFQLGIVDAMAANRAEQDTYAKAYTAYRETERQLDELRALAAKTRKDQDYTAFQFQQLEEAHLTDPNEMTQLEDEHFRLANADSIRQGLEYALQVLDSDNGALSLVHNAQCTMHNELDERLKNAEIDLRDIVRDIQREADRTEIDPERLQTVEERIEMLQTLLRKHDVQSLEELITLRDQLEAQLSRLANFDEDIQQLEQKLQRDLTTLSNAANALTRSREKMRQPISQALELQLHALGIAHAKMDIAITPLDDYTESGHDDVQFLFAANLNQSLRRVSEVASGGEISRIMLCIKSLIASTSGLPTILFDEIDTGVSGEVATQMGQIMRQMAASRQIIAITHLPQIAAQGQTHYCVYKQDTQARTQTHIRQLTSEERITEIASMLAGRQISDSVLDTARQLLTANH